MPKIELATVAIGLTDPDALRADLQKRQQRRDDDDADQRKESAFVSIRKDGDSASCTLARSSSADAFVSGSANPNRRSARMKRASGKPTTV